LKLWVWGRYFTYSAIALFNSDTLPLTYKGLAVFTPGGDVVYCIDPSKQGHWHVQLCAAIGQILDLPESPLFLSNCFSATVDCWVDSQTQVLKVAAEAKPKAWQYRSLLEVIFNTPVEQWQLDSTASELCGGLILENYREQFPQLWEHHNLVARLDQLSAFKYAANPDLPNPLSGYVLRLFVSGQNNATIDALEHLYQFLEQTLETPYTLRVIDVQQYPELAEEDHITATPTLIKIWPPPVRRLVGGLDQCDRIIKLLS
jgi:circadian clock protein KaiB